MDVIRINEANCRDCYKCLRHCPVKAICMERPAPSQPLHARVDADRCILDGRCIAVCPQKAKDVHHSWPMVRQWIKAGESVSISLAPSFAAAFPEYRNGQVLAALRKLGFSGVYETALGANWVAEEHARLAREKKTRTLITSSCPAVVNLIGMYYPDALPLLAPVVSPMIAHARWLKQHHPDRRVVFAGPCLAKYAEIDEAELRGAVDQVVAFRELEQWWQEEGVDPSKLGEEPFDGSDSGDAHLFPLDGGLLRTAALSTDLLANEVLTVSGVEDCQMFLEGLTRENVDLPRMVEMTACSGGCINGPLMPLSNSLSPFARRRRILRYKAEHPGYTGKPGLENPGITREGLFRTYSNRAIALPEPAEEDIRSILGKSGKHSASDELNCGACGYGSCREKAVAVYRGLADPEMCIPYMRERAESLSNLVVDSTPNGVLVVDSEGVILDINIAAERMFQVPRTVAVGWKIGRLIESDAFVRVLNGEERMVRFEQELPGLELVLRVIVVRAEGENIAMALLEDITEQRRREMELQRVRQETLGRAQEVIDKQMAVAQKIAGLLGETTAETKVLLTRLMRVMKEEGNTSGSVSGNGNRTTE